MVQEVTPDTADDLVIYPESDGQPMAQNTIQFRWIVIIKEGLEVLFAKNLDIFVAGDLFWYPVQGDNSIKYAPDTMVVFGRPKGDRSSYLQWKEANIPPQVVFEILSPGNTDVEMKNKFRFYNKYGVEEYYIYDPDSNTLKGFLRSNKNLTKIININGWTSPRLKVKFVITPTTLEIYRPDGRKLLTPIETEECLILEQQQRQQAEQRAELAEQQAETERQRYQELLRQLQDRGIEL